MNKKFSIKLTYYLSKNIKDLIKTYISVLNFSTESAKKLTIYDLLFLIALYSSKTDNKHPLLENCQNFTEIFC